MEVTLVYLSVDVLARLSVSGLEKNKILKKGMASMRGMGARRRNMTMMRKFNRGRGRRW